MPSSPRSRLANRGWPRSFCHGLPERTDLRSEHPRETMTSFDELLEEAKIAHGHLCAGQILGVRLAMLGCARLGIGEPRGRDRKRLVTFVEIDRCATDAIGVVTGCRLGKRALKFRDWGKMAATFVDVGDGRALRIAARESSKEQARALHPEIGNK